MAIFCFLTRSLLLTRKPCLPDESEGSERLGFGRGEMQTLSPGCWLLHQILEIHTACYQHKNWLVRPFSK